MSQSFPPPPPPLTRPQPFPLGRQPMMFHPEPVLPLPRRVARIPRMDPYAVPYARRVRHFPLDVLEDLRLLRLRLLLVLLVIRPASAFAVEFRELRGSGRGGEPRPLQRVRRGDAVHDRRLVVPWNLGHHLTVPRRRPIPSNQIISIEMNFHSTFFPPLF